MKRNYNCSKDAGMGKKVHLLLKTINVIITILFSTKYVYFAKIQI